MANWEARNLRLNTTKNSEVLDSVNLLQGIMQIMDLKKKTMKQLVALERKKRPEFISNTFLILALLAGCFLSEIMNIIHEKMISMGKENYHAFVFGVFILGFFSIGALFYSVHQIGIKPFDDVFNEIERRLKKKK